MNYEEDTCPSIHPDTNATCYRSLDHKGDHYPEQGEYCWPNGDSPRTTVELDREELYTLWVVMKTCAPGHVRYGRINDKLTAALNELGEDVALTQNPYKG